MSESTIPFENDARRCIIIPYEGGYVGIESIDGGRSWFYCRDVGIQSREWWLRYCMKHNYILPYE